MVSKATIGATLLLAGAQASLLPPMLKASANPIDDIDPWGLADFQVGTLMGAYNIMQ